MNYYTINANILEALTDIFGSMPNTAKVNFAADYSQNRKLTSVTVQVENAPYYHGLIFIYTRSVSLYDVLKYRNKTIYRQGQLTQMTPQINLINKFILKHIPHMNQLAQRKIKEEMDDAADIKNDSLKNSLEQCKNQKRSYRDEIGNLKDKIAIINKKQKRNS
jgi:hypothetical protein